MATIQKRGISLLLVLVLILGMIPSVSAAENNTQPSTEPAEPTTPLTEETLAAETSPPEATQPEETSPPETTAPEQTVPTEPAPEETESEEETEPVEESPSEDTEEDPAPDEELSLSLMSLDDGVATIADTEIIGAPNAFGNVFLLNGGIDIPSFDHVQHKEHLPLYSVYLKNQPGYENNYYVAYCIEPGVVLGESGGHTGSSTTVGGMTDGTGALEWLSREQVEAMGIVLLYGQREIARRADAESLRLQKLARHAATQVLIWEIASGWRSATPPYTRYDSTFYDAIVPPLECAVQVWGTKFYLDGIDDAYNEIVTQMEQHYKIPSFMKSSKSSAPTYELIADGNGKYSITLTDSNNILSQYTFTNTSNLTFSVSGNKLTVTANGPISDTLVAPTKQVPNLDSQVFYVWEYKEQQKLMSCKTEPVNNPMPAYFYVTAPDQTASLDLTKTTEDGKNLSGWKFGIYSDSGCSNLISGPHTTDAKGKISVADLTAGTVYVKELGHTDSTINALYSCDSTNPQKVVLIAGETATVSFHNRLNTGDLKLVKQTNTGKNLVGWLIGLYYDSACTKPVSGSPFTTGTNGTITVNGLKPGTFYAKEIPTDDPYWEFDTTVKEVKIVANQTATVTFTNTHFGRIKFQKTTNTGNHLGGWTFRVTDANGNHVGDYTTDENGEAYTGNLPLGRYTVQELSVDDDYWNCELGFHDVTVKAGETVVDEWQNKEQGLGWFRKTTNTGENLSGWEIAVYSDEACTQKVCTVTTDETGKTGHYLDPGIYYAKETGDTMGRFNDEYWLIDKTVYRFEIKPHEETTVTFSNTHYGKLNILKTMDTDGPLDGWQFRVTDGSGKEITGSPFTSDKNGEIHVGNILPGVYKIEELIPDDSLYYCKSENPQTVTVKKGETAEVSFTNALQPGKITIEKVDLRGEHLTGAKFLLEWSEDGSLWWPIEYSDSKDVIKGFCSNPDVVDGTLTTDLSGIIEWSNLHPGLYYRITELEAPEGYVLLTEAAYEDKLPADDLEVMLRVINCEAFTLPKTGSGMELFFSISRMLCIAVCGTMLFFSFRKKRRA